MKLNHIVTADQLSQTQIGQLFKEAQKIEKIMVDKGEDNRLKGRVVATLFFEPSTRTSGSFIAATQRLGGSVVTINDGSSSSVAKGETLEDTIRTLEQYADCIVLRHPEIGAAQRAANVAHVPIINAGDGAGEHPTQALLDVFTILREQGTIDGLTITMVGDLKHGRTVHSLARLLELYDVKLQFVSPAELMFPDSIKQKLKNPFAETTNLKEALETTDVLYVTRIQKERFSDPSLYEKVKDEYIIMTELLQHAKGTMTIMHPLPRVNEIAADVDNDPRAAYFRQMRNGLYVRMALLDSVINNK